MKASPYPTYRPSGVEWLGDVPEHWGTVALRWCSVRYAGGTPDRNKEHYWDDGAIPWINSGAVNQKLITEPSALITDEGFAGSSAKWIPSGALVMALAGQGRTKGMVAQVAIQTTCNQSMAAIVPHERVSARYVFWLLDAQYEVIRNLAGGEQRDGLNLEILGGLPVLLPTLHEQRVIAAFLDRETERIDALVAKKRQLIERLQEYRTALITRTVTGGLPPGAARAAGLDPSPRLKPSGVEWLGDVPEHWEVKNLKRCVPGVTVGIVVTPSKYYEDEGVPCLRSFNVLPQELTDTDLVYISSESNELHRKSMIFEGDVVVVRSGRPGAAAVVDGRFDGANAIDLIIIRGSQQISSEFLAYAFASSAVVHQIAVGSGGSVQEHFNIERARQLMLVLPPAEEQAYMVDYLDREMARVGALIDRAEAGAERLQEYRTALITAAVTGKIDVRESATTSKGPAE